MRQFANGRSFSVALSHLDVNAQQVGQRVDPLGIALTDPNDDTHFGKGKLVGDEFSFACKFQKTAICRQIKITCFRHFQ